MVEAFFIGEAGIGVAGHEAAGERMQGANMIGHEFRTRGAIQAERNQVHMVERRPQRLDALTLSLIHILSIDQLIPRVVFSRGFDYWESGMDVYPGRDMYDSFCNYQTALMAEFDRLSEEYKFEVIEASADAEQVFEHLKAGIFRALESDSRKEYISCLLYTSRCV